MSGQPPLPPGGGASRDDRVAPTLLIAACDLRPGPHLTSSGEDVVVTEPVQLGHKVAARTIAAGASVVRCGVPIGSASTDIERGAWVHTHNLMSDYLATFAHRGGQR